MTLSFSVLSSSIAGSFLDLLVGASRESMLDPASPRRRVTPIGTTDLLLGGGKDSFEGSDSLTAAACTFGEWAALAVYPSHLPSFHVNLPFVVPSLCPPPAINAHALTQTRLPSTRSGWRWSNLSMVGSAADLLHDGTNGSIVLFVDCSCLPYTHGGSGTVSNAELGTGQSSTSAAFLVAAAALLERVPQTTWKISIASSSSVRFGGCELTSRPSDDHSGVQHLYDVVEAFNHHGDGVAGRAKIQQLDGYVRSCAAAVASAAARGTMAPTALPFVVVDVEDVASGRRSCVAWFCIPAMAHETRLCGGAAPTMVGRGLVHLATLMQLPGAAIVLDVPNLDLESSNLDSTTHDFVQCMVAVRLLCWPALVDAHVTFANPLSTSMLMLHQVSDTERKRILAELLGEWKRGCHDAMLRRCIELDFETDTTALDDGDIGERRILFSQQDCELMETAFVVIAEAVVAWAGRSQIDPAQNTPARVAANTARNQDRPKHGDDDSHKVPLSAADRLARELSPVADGIHDMSPIIDDGSDVASPPLPCLHEQSPSFQASNNSGGDGMLGNKATASPELQSPTAIQQQLAVDLMSSGVLSFNDSIDIQVASAGNQGVNNVASSSPDPQRGPSLFRLEDSFSPSGSTKLLVHAESRLATAALEALREEVRVLKATISALEHEKHSEVAAAQETISQLRHQVHYEQQQTKRWQSEARNLFSMAQAAFLQVPMKLAGAARDDSASESASLTTLPETPQSPLPLNNSVSSPTELRAARRLRQQQHHHLSVFSAFRHSGSLSPRLATDHSFTSFAAHTPQESFDEKASSVASSVRHASNAQPASITNHLITTVPHESLRISATIRLMQAQAFRRALMEMREAKEARKLIATWSQDAVHKSHVFVKKTLRRFHDSVETTIKAQHRMAMEVLEEKTNECVAALSRTTTTVPPVDDQVPREVTTPAKAVGNSCGSVGVLELSNLSMTEAAFVSSIGKRKSPVTDFLVTPVRTTRENSLRTSFASASQGRHVTPRHRLMLSAPGTAIVSTRPETAQLFIMAGRNLRGEERKSAGERVPNLKFDQIRKEAVTWKQNHLDEFKLFASHQVIFLGDGHVGKSSLVACLTNKAPVLFKKAPQVSTPTLDIRRTRATVLLDRSHGSAAVVPLGGYPKLTMVEAARICREQSSMKEPATLPASATTCALPLCLTEIPSAILRAPSRAVLLPQKGAIFCIVFRLCDDVEVSRQAILRYVQHVVGSMSRRGRNGNRSKEEDEADGAPTTTVPFVLMGTHADQSVGSNGGTSESTSSQDLTSAQNALASFRRWLEEEFQAIGSKSILPVVLDTFAVSCANWTVYGERPRSADSFPAMLADWAAYLTLHAPTAPTHLLPSARLVVNAVDCEGPFSDEDGEQDAEDNTVPHSSQKAEVMVDYIWARRGGGSQSGGLFSTTASTKSQSLWSNNPAATATLPKDGSSARSLALTMTERWLHCAAVGLITLFTALQRFTEFTGYVLDATMFDNIVFQHLELAPRMDDERRLSKRLLRIRDVIVEEILAECDRRGLIVRLRVPSSDELHPPPVPGNPPYTDVVVLGTLWLDQTLSLVMLPYTMQLAATLPTSAPSVRQQFGGVGNRHVVSLLQRAAAMGVDLTSSATPVELASYRVGHVSRKLLFQLLPPPIRSVASTQRGAAAFFAAIGMTPLTAIEQQSPSELSGGSFSSPTSELLHFARGGVESPLGCSSSSLFIPCVSFGVSSTVVAFLDDVAHLIAEDVHVATIQVEIPSMDLFYTAQSRLHRQAFVRFHDSVTSLEGIPGERDAMAGFCAVSARNCFMVTADAQVWVLVIAVGGTESDCTFSEYRVVVARHSVSHGVDDEISMDGGVSELVECIADAFAAHRRSGVEGTGDAHNDYLTVDGPCREKRMVESWSKTEQRVREVLQDLAVEESEGSNGSIHNNQRERLRGMMERTERPSLRQVLQLLHLQSA